ncbi:hypothetical protein DFR28_101139 [Arenicella xantha]|uniref:Large extracellular alpha-helical protein n=2 Tax=Arenicella xantha TaxID=644221 RepID=A0A395JQN3_9GAMM|nr:hypothetical protein DFR28_101139 [Arenicella xantha]
MDTGRLLILVLLFIVAPTYAQLAYDSADFNQRNEMLSLLRVTPHGEQVPISNRQVVFKFNQPVVPVGDMQRESASIPITFQPAVNCEWLWLDTSSLACQLKKRDQLRLATRYLITVNPGITTVAGDAMSSPQTFEFTTIRPAVSRVYLHQWVDAGRPVMQVSFNQPVTRSSVLRLLSLWTGSQSISLVAPELHNSLRGSFHLRTTSDAEFEQTRSLGRAVAEEPDTSEVVAELDSRRNAFDYARSTWYLVPSKDLPVDTPITLRLHAGLTSIWGNRTGSSDMQVHQFRSLPEFSFVGVECRQKDSNENVVVAPTHTTQTLLRDAESKQKIFADLPECQPLSSASLLFSTPVSYATAKLALTVTPDLAGGLVDYDPWAARQDEYQLRYFFKRRFNYADTRPYRMMLPEVLKAFEQYRLTSNENLLDELGRALPSSMDMSFLTAHRTPRLHLDHQHSVFEKTLDTELPVTVTNLDKLVVNGYSKTTATEHSANQQYEKPLPVVEDIAYAVPLGVREMLNGESGIVVGELTAQASEPGLTNYVPRFVSQVTPFQVHLKLGHFKSIAWVTDLATGEPVANASLRIEVDNYQSISPFVNGKKLDNDSAPTVKTDRHGVAVLPGQLAVDPTLRWLGAGNYRHDRLMLKVSKGDDFAVLPVDYNYSAWSDVWPHMQRKNSYTHAWGTTAQGIYKAGDTIQYKLYVRNQSNDHWVAPPAGEYTLEVVDPKDQVVEKISDLTLSEFGSYAGEFNTNAAAAVGWYQFRLSIKADGAHLNLAPMRVLVSDFTPASFRVSTELNGDQFESGDTLQVSTAAKMHAGGPYADADTRVTAMINPTRFVSRHPAAKGFFFGKQVHSGRITAHQSVAPVSQEGELNTEFTLGDYAPYFGRLVVESAVRDERGKYVASSASADYVGRNRFVGLKNTRWVHKVSEPASVEVVVVDAKGQPVSNTAVSVQIEHEVTRAARVKSAGNAYLTQYSREWVKQSDCQLVSTEQALSCDFEPTAPGRYRIVANIQDTKQRANQSVLKVWVVGKGQVVWGDDDRQLELIADAESYKSGDTAKFLIKNPYPDAQALITVERYGVRRHWQQTLQGSTPIIEVPIEADDYPGVYVSVVVTSPRVAQPLGDGQVDLGKPTFKLGYAALKVVDDSKQLEVEVKSDRELYRPRETVVVDLRAKPKAGRATPIEAAVVVIDEAVFDLNRSGTAYYDPYLGFNHLDTLGVSNYNLLMRLVGRQKFEKKGANPGGGGGGEDAPDLRNVMKFVAYWNPSIKLDKRGKGQFEFELPDNLTGWRVFVMAVTSEDQMGLGDAQFKVNRPTELRPVMPNQLTEGDQVQAGFSVMNRTSRTRQITVDLKAAGDALSAPLSKQVTLAMAPYERTQVWLDVSAAKYGEIAFMAKAGDQEDQDALEHHVPVNKRRALISAATYGTTLGETVSEKIAFPAGIYSDVGGLSVQISPTVLGNLNGAFEYLRDYPYFCWEQRLSKSLGAAQFMSLNAYLDDDLTWPESQQVVSDTFASAASFQAPNGGMTYWINDNRYVSPYLSAYTAMGFVWLRKAGHTPPEQVESRLHEYLKTYLRRDDSDLSNQQRTMQGMRSSIRAVALAALAASGQLDAQELARYKPHWSSMDLFGKAHFLQAAVALEQPIEELSELSQNLLSFSSQSGGKFQFNESLGNDYGAMLHTPLRSNCAILSSLLQATAGSPELLHLIGDVPFKQVRAITQTRGNRDHWQNTQENVFCMNALLEFSRVYEKEPPAMLVDVTLHTDKYGVQDLGNTRFDDLRNPPVTLANETLPVESNLAGDVAINKQGTGRVYYGVRLQYAKTEDAASAVNAGMEINREYSVERDGRWHLLESPMQLEKGELVRVDLFVSTPTARHFVVIDDPVPGGLEPVNRDLATASEVDADKGAFIASQHSWWFQRDSWQSYGRYGYSFYHKELRHNSARFYSDYLPAGDYHLSYTAQAIAGGEFSVMPFKASEMYDPDVYGLGVPASLQVEKVK